MTRNFRIKNKYLEYFLMMLILLGIDSIPKVLFSILNLGQMRLVSITSFFNIELFENRNMAFHIFKRLRPPFKNIIIYGLFVLTILILLEMIKKTIGLRFKWFLPWLLIFTGTMSNFIDRIINGYITDYFNLDFQNIFFIYFNFADTYVCVGLIIFLIQYFISKRQNQLIMQTSS